MKRFVVVPILVCAFAIVCLTQNYTQTSRSFDVLHYDLQLEPDIDRKSVTGKVSIKLISLTNNLTEIELNCGELTIDSVVEKGKAQKFLRSGRTVMISLTRPAIRNHTRDIEIEYHGSPRWGIRFFPDQHQVYTVFSTSQWMVCVDAPEDRATLELNLILPSNLNGVANGRLINQRQLANNRTAYVWRQDSAIPSYIFGFSVGPFRTITQKHRDLELRYMSERYSDEELRRIFRDTAHMLDFFEDRAGVKYADSVYTQVLAAGGVEQEMSSFTALRENYGRDVLSNERDIWLGAHEFAHQWWGNMVTCRDWTHFWLNEGFASFMASAYKEHRFGRDEYLKDINDYLTSYEKVRDAGKDRSLVFPDWDSPTAEDRTLVYDKGAYVLHLLREEMGERDFWRGIRQYTRKYFGRSVVTADFQQTMEQTSGKSLSKFFDRWVYHKRT